VDLEEELEDVAVGDPCGIEDDLDGLGMPWVVGVGRVVVLPAGVADAGRDDAVALAQQLLDAPEATSGEDCCLGVVAPRYAASGVTSPRCLSITTAAMNTQTQNGPMLRYTTSNSSPIAATIPSQPSQRG
jgi:hypothetical protein